MAKKTIRRHCENIDFYVNHFLLHEDAGRAEEGARRVGVFLGYWFIRKAAWATQTSIKPSAASLKKFYTFMFEKGRIGQDGLDDLKTEIREDMAEGLETLARYDDPEIDDPAEVWGI